MAYILITMYNMQRQLMHAYWPLQVAINGKHIVALPPGNLELSFFAFSCAPFGPTLPRTHIRSLYIRLARVPLIDLFGACLGCLKKTQCIFFAEPLLLLCLGALAALQIY
jgi:hypothetical protein